jgi:UDP-N-acetylmuramoyl-tripeptide--D-alanyl-D-alanine ligase
MSAMMTLAQAAAWMPGAVLQGDGATEVMRVHTDTRSIESGDLFVALQGERFDANAMLHQARAAGAAAVVCRAGLAQEAYPADIPRIEVADTKQALAALATGWRAQWEIPLIAVTGSNGKTTVTQMIASILHAYAPEGHALATAGNFNNDIGVPLTILRLRAHHRIAVLELGMNHPGEIALLAEIAKPTVALVNNAQREHLEFMHTIEAVARENGSVFEALPADGCAVYPADDTYAPMWDAVAANRASIVFAASATGADVALKDSRWVNGAWQVHVAIPQGELHYRLAIAGRHNVKNSLAAAACAIAAGVPASDVIKGLESFTPVKGRCRAQQVRHGGLDFTLVDDTYNANPDSMRAAIEVLADLPGPRLLIIGDMGEVGVDGPAFHAEAGRYAKERGIEHVLAIGDASLHAVQQLEGARHFVDLQALHSAAWSLLPQVSSVLVKGSRFMRMERVVDALAAQPERGEELHVA